MRDGGHASSSSSHCPVGASGGSIQMDTVADMGAGDGTESVDNVEALGYCSGLGPDSTACTAGSWNGYTNNLTG